MPRSKWPALFALAIGLAIGAASAEGEGGCQTLETAMDPDCAGAYPVPPEVQDYHNAARALERAGNYRAALALYAEALAKLALPAELYLPLGIPESVRRRRGIVHRQLGDYVAAMADFTTLIDADLGNAQARHERASTLLRLDRPAEALADSDFAVWLRPQDSDFRALRADILAALGRQAEADAERIIAEALRAEAEPARNRPQAGLLEPGGWVARQRFRLQRSCPEDDRQVLTLRIDDGRVSATPSYVGVAGAITLHRAEGRLLITMGVAPCQVRVVIGKDDLAVDAPPATDADERLTFDRHSDAEPVVADFYPAPAVGCARGTIPIRVYWGSVDHSYSMQLPTIRARFDTDNRRRSKQLRATHAFGSKSCRIAIQIWKAS